MKTPCMVVLATDFGIQDPYIGQLKSILAQRAPATPIIDLIHNLPDYNIRASAYLLAALVDTFPLNSLFLCVVDPGVGSERDACVVQIDQRWYVGPDNGLFDVLRRRSKHVRWWKVPAPDEGIAATFHARDVFAPVVARLCNGDMAGLEVSKLPAVNEEWPEDLPEIVYIDHYGNLMSGYRFSSLAESAKVSLKGKVLRRARTFSDVKAGEGFYYKNANGLLEVAVNQGSAEILFTAQIGDELLIEQ